MNNWINSPNFIHIELTSRCNKVPSCWMCGRRRMEKEHPELCNWGDMDFELLKKIAKEVPKGIVVHLHNNGEPTLYPKLREAIKLFKDQITHFDSNCILLLKKSDEIIDNLDILTVSVIENDPLGDKQFETVKKFLEIKKDRKPRVVFRLLGDIGILTTYEKYRELINYEDCFSDKHRKQRWYDLAKKYNCTIATRTLHSPYGSYNYKKKVTVPEIGICWELLTHLSIDRFGDVYPCVRYNPYKYNLLGNVKNKSLLELWSSKKRLKLIEEHKKGNRSYSELCAKCDYYGIPVG